MAENQQNNMAEENAKPVDMNHILLARCTDA